MTAFEYKVVPAPFEGSKASGLGGAEQRYARTLAEVMNALGADGWEYQRAEVLPLDAAVDATSASQVFCNVLVFRRRLMATRRTSRDGSRLAPLLLKRQMLADDAPALNVLLLSQPEGSADAKPMEPADGNAPDASLATQSETQVASGTDEPAPTKRKTASPAPIARPNDSPAPAPVPTARGRSRAQISAPIPHDAKANVLSLKGFAAPALDLSNWAAPQTPAPHPTDSRAKPASVSAPRTPSSAASRADTTPRTDPGPALRSRAAQIRARNSGLADE